MPETLITQGEKKAALSAKRRLNNWNKKYLMECHLVTYWPMDVPVQNINCCSILEAVTCLLKGFFFPNCYFSSAYGWWVNFSSVFSSLSKKKRQRSASEIQQGLWRVKWNQGPLSGCTESTPPARQWQEMLRNSWCREHNFPLQLQPYWCAFLCTLWSSMPSPGISDSFKAQFNR